MTTILCLLVLVQAAGMVWLYVKRPKPPPAPPPTWHIDTEDELAKLNPWSKTRPVWRYQVHPGMPHGLSAELDDGAGRMHKLPFLRIRDQSYYSPEGIPLTREALDTLSEAIEQLRNRSKP